jgi:hypothetical protein
MTFCNPKRRFILKILFPASPPPSMASRTTFPPPSRSGDFMGRRFSNMALAITLLSCNVADPSGTQRPQRPSFLTADGLTVTITQNPPPPSNFTKAAGPYTLTANVTGGTGPFLYQWGQRRCSKASCPRDYARPGGGGAGSQITWTVLTNDIFSEFVVQVRRSAADQASVAKFSIWGPQDMPEPGPVYGTTTCNFGTVGWTYPFDPSSGACRTLGTTCYRRNPCTGIRESYHAP